MKNPTISIIIPTYNSEKHINRCLESIKDQNYKFYEVIVVDQSSTDETAAIAKRYGCKVIKVAKPNFYSPPSISRNIGAVAAKGRILYHLDSDMILQQGLLREISEMVKKGREAFIVHESDLTEDFWGKCKAFERKCYWGNDKIESARVVSAKIFKRVGGYNEGVSSGEDFNIHKKYKALTKIGFCNKVVFHNLGGLNYWKAVMKKYNYGKTAMIYSPENKESGLVVLMDELSCFVKNYPRFLTSPIYGVGALFLKLSEYIAGGVGFFHNRFFAKNKKYLNI